MKLLVRLLAILGLLFVASWGIALATKKSSPLSGDDDNDPAKVEKGAYLAIAGDCVACHTAPGGKPNAGGLAMPIPILGTLYSPNITPDAKDGIGSYSLADFDRAVRFGVRKDGTNLYPAMPYVSFAKLSDDDVSALYTYFKYGVNAVAQVKPAEKIDWPLNIRWPVQLWNDMFVSTKPFQPSATQPDDWNRGAYLVQGLGHCGTCHTPRSVALQEVALDQNSDGFLSGGAVLAGWQAPNITSDPNSGIGKWTKEQVQQYLSTGNAPDLAQAAGSMNEAVVHSFSKLKSKDIAAIATYLATVPAVQDDKPTRGVLGKPATGFMKLRGVDLPEVESVADAPIDPERIFLGACASCHKWTGTGSFSGYYPSLNHNTAVGMANPVNLTQVILNGINRPLSGQPVLMPGFKNVLSDAEIAALVNYLTRQFGNADVKISETGVRTLRGL